MHREEPRAIAHAALTDFKRVPPPAPVAIIMERESHLPLLSLSESISTPAPSPCRPAIRLCSTSCQWRRSNCVEAGTADNHCSAARPYRGARGPRWMRGGTPTRRGLRRRDLARADLDHGLESSSARRARESPAAKPWRLDNNREWVKNRLSRCAAYACVPQYIGNDRQERRYRR
jgi:hypothetical protein